MRETDRKRYILDTSVLIHDPLSIFAFEANDVLIPYVVLHELDDLREAPNGRGMSARTAIRELETLRETHSTLQDVPLGEGLGNLTVLGREEPIIRRIPHDRRDDMIIAVAQKMMGESDERIIVVSKDMGLRLKSSVIGVPAEDYRASKVDQTYIGLHEGTIIVKGEDGTSLLGGKIDAPDYLLENEFCYIEQEDYESVGATLCRRKRGKLQPVDHFQRKAMMGIRPMDDYQRMAFDVLLDDDIVCVALIGVAGSGKTLISLAAGLEFINQGEHEGLITIKPIVPVGGRDIGYLKGDKQDKLHHWQKPILDNMRVINMYSGRSSRMTDPDFLLDEGIWQPEAMTFMRGRHLHGQWLLLDEVQNFSGHEIKTALSRVGEKTKVVALADPSQIDNPYVDASSCGASVMVDKMKGSELFAVVPMRNSQRSVFAQEVADRMGNG